MEAIQLFRDLFIILGWSFFAFLVLSPIFLCLYVTAFAKSTEEFSGLPYVAALFYCLLWVWGGLFVIPNSSTGGTSVFGIAAAFEAVYVTIFIIYAPKREKAKILGLVALLFTILCTAALVGQFALHGRAAKERCIGVALIFYSSLLFGSPLTMMGTVTRTKSVYYMPFSLSLFGFLCATSWFISGLLFLDPFFCVANGIGCALGSLQLILYYKYRDEEGYFIFHGDTTKPEEPTARASVEMGVRH